MKAIIPRVISTQQTFNKQKIEPLTQRGVQNDDEEQKLKTSRKVKSLEKLKQTISVQKQYNNFFKEEKTNIDQNTKKTIEKLEKENEVEIII